MVAVIDIGEAEPASAAPCDSVLVSCTVGSGGAAVELTRAELNRSRQGLDIKTGAPDKRVFEYTSVYACPSNTPGGTDVFCAAAAQACAANTLQQGQGPRIRLYRRELDAKGVPLTPWQLIGTTCSPDLVPGRPVLGLGQILSAFHNTPWARPRMHIQPEGNVTLVTLPTYFAVSWPLAGFQPGEVDTLTLLGHKVQIRPTLVSYSYVFGDGLAFRPTRSAGGPYPSGDITHAYAQAGVYSTHIDVTFGGEFTLDGGGRTAIPDTVTVAGPAQPLTVKTAESRLVTR